MLSGWKVLAKKGVENLSEEEETSFRPELVFGLVGPIGCDIDAVQTELERALKQVDYTPSHINLSSSFSDLYQGQTGKPLDAITLEEKIAAGNKVRAAFGNDAVLACEAILQIREVRAELHEADDNIEDGVDPESMPASDAAYIIRQLKRKEEIELLSKTYGKQFIQVSISQDRESRIDNICRTLQKETPGRDPNEVRRYAEDLDRKDENELREAHGQRVNRIFHLGDVFIDGSSPQSIHYSCNRFIQALFGRNDIGPTRDEFGSYMAKTASMRSVDLSRQVGAAILTPEGDIVSIGCNEVPKPGGGNYWDDDEKKARDIDRRGEANKLETKGIIIDFLDTLEAQGLLAEGTDRETILSDHNHRKAIEKSRISDITEYGRMVHAEMNAITDATRLGRSVKGCTLFVTTFPCHNCAKHIIAAGISRIVFIEPYPKSRTKQLFREAISEVCSPPQTWLGHFVGIAPRRYGDIFEKGKRRDEEGNAVEWYNGSCEPRIGDRQPIETLDGELHAINDNMFET